MKAFYIVICGTSPEVFQKILALFEPLVFFQSLLIQPWDEDKLFLGSEFALRSGDEAMVK